VVDKASASILIEADKATVMAVIADLESYPEWSAAIKAVTIDEVWDDEDERVATATFNLDAGILKDTYTLSYEWDGDDRVEWHLVTGRTLKAQDGSYALREVDGSTEVTYELAVDLAVPMLGMFKRKAEKAIIDTALKGLKQRVEADSG
jgi:ribosome-associated toxin RatA of RatAB toxin-antitoxin module